MLADIALIYRGKGQAVIPVKGTCYAKGNTEEERSKDSKTPLIRWTDYQTKLPSEAQIREWFTKWDQANMAVITGKVSGIVVVDFDSKEAVKYAKDKGLLNTPLVKTGRGYHAYFKYPLGRAIKNSVNSALKIDIRGDGGYVVIPPSTHFSGMEYRWVEGHSLGEIELAVLPEVFLQETAQGSEGKTPLKDLYKGVSAGGRNFALARLVGSWVNDGLEPEECIENAVIWNQKNNPPLPISEIKAVVGSIYKKYIATGGNTRSSAKKELVLYERNLLKLPLFTCSKDRVHKAGVIEYLKKSPTADSKWTVSSGTMYGLGGPFDDLVFMTLSKIISELPKPVANPVKIGSLKKLALQFLSNPGGRDITKIKESLKRLAHTTINSHYTFFDKEKKRFVDETFHIIDRIKFVGEEKTDGAAWDSTFVWMGELFLNNINHGGTIPIDYKCYVSLETYTARAIYKLLYPIFMANNGSPIAIKYSTVCERCQVTDEKYLSQAKQQLLKPHEALKKGEVITTAKWLTKKNINYIVYTPHPSVCPRKKT